MRTCSPVTRNKWNVILASLQRYLLTIIRYLSSDSIDSPRQPESHRGRRTIVDRPLPEQANFPCSSICKIIIITMGNLFSKKHFHIEFMNGKNRSSPAGCLQKASWDRVLLETRLLGNRLDTWAARWISLGQCWDMWKWSALQQRFCEKNMRDNFSMCVCFIKSSLKMNYYLCISLFRIFDNLLHFFKKKISIWVELKALYHKKT